jgi:hypothetical protein
VGLKKESTFERNHRPLQASIIIENKQRMYCVFQNELPQQFPFYIVGSLSEILSNI